MPLGGVGLLLAEDEGDELRDLAEEETRSGTGDMAGENSGESRGR